MVQAAKTRKSGSRPRARQAAARRRVEAARIGKRGTLVIPAPIRKRFGLTEGSFVTVEERGDAVVLRPATILPVEVYTPERIAEFLLNNALDEEDYARAVKKVKEMGLDPTKIDHTKP